VITNGSSVIASDAANTRAEETSCVTRKDGYRKPILYSNIWEPQQQTETIFTMKVRTETRRGRQTASYGPQNKVHERNGGFY
jgi:hypothetical protein